MKPSIHNRTPYKPMTRRLFLSVLLIAWGVLPLSAVKLSGYITDLYSGEVLSDACILVGSQLSFSNNYGYYVLHTEKGEQYMSVSFVGYETKKIHLRVENDTTVHVALKKGLELPEVVLTARHKSLDSRGLGNIKVNVSQLRASPLFFGERDVVKTLQFLPGVSAGMEGSSQLNIRGGTNDQTLYLMDDVPVYNQNHTLGFFSIFNADALLSADLYKGGIPSMYGDRLSGVVAVKLKDGNDKRHTGSLSLGMLAGTLALEGPIVRNKLSYLLTARRSFIDWLYDGVMALASEGGDGGAMISFYDINGKISWKINPRTKLSWQIYTGYDDLYGRNKEKSSYEDRSFQEKFGFGWKSQMSSLSLTSDIRPELFFSGSLYYTQLDNFQYYKNSQKEAGTKSSLENNTSSLLREAGVKLSLQQKLNNRHSLFYGLNASTQAYTPNRMYKKLDKYKEVYDVDTQELLSASAYLYDEIRYGSCLFSVGLRASAYHHAGKTKWAWEPRLKVNTWLGEENKLMLAYDRMYQPVHSINEMNYNVQTDFWLPFKENRLPSSHQLSAGWKNYSFDRFSFSLEAYYKKMNHLLLIRNLDNYLDFHTDYERGEGQSVGVEGLAEYAKDRFSGWLSYTLSRSERTFGGKTYPFKYDATHDVSVFASYVVRKRERTHNTLSLNAQYKTGYPYYIPELRYPSAGLPTLPNGYAGLSSDISTVDYIPQYPNIRLKEYFRLDINFTMEQKMKHGSRTWQFSLLNATGHQNPYAVYKTKDGGYKAFLLIPFLPSFSFTRTF